MRGLGVLVVAGAALFASGCGDDGSQGTGGSTSSSATGTGTGGGQGGGGGAACSTDADCTAGSEWCVGGACSPCDNSGLACDIACIAGWSTYERNGCFPCACAPQSACLADSDCPPPGGGAAPRCYAGNFCWDWCPPGDPSCCHGNTCSAAGCPGPNPTGCFTTGCAEGEQCEDTGCASSGCGCDGASWSCLADCGGGTCVPPG